VSSGVPVATTVAPRAASNCTAYDPTPPVAPLTRTIWPGCGSTAAVRSLVLDPLTKAQVKQLTNIGQRIMHAIDPDDDA
jgi:hypothetical protein